MAEFEYTEELTATCEGEIADLLHADLNLRTTNWTNSSSDLITEDTNEVQEEICDSVVEEIVVDQENDNYLTCIDDECMEESIVYVFEEPIVEFELSDSHYIIKEPDEYQLETDTMISDSDADATIEESVVQETANCSDVVTSDNALKTCNFNENSDSVDNNLLNSALIDENNKISSDVVQTELQTPVQVNSLYGDDDSNIVIESMPENIPEPSTPEPAKPLNPAKPEANESVSPKTSPNMLPSVLNRNKSTPLVKPVLNADLNSPKEIKNPQSENSSPGLRTLGKEQIKKRLQSFSLLKQGITAIPIKKIISPKQPKVHLQIGEVYDEAGRKTDEKIIIKKPPKQGPTPSEKARQVIDEIEQIKREEAAIYEQTLSFMKHSMRESHKKKSKIRLRDRERSKSPIRRDKKFDKDHSKRIRKISEDDKFRKSFENDKFKKKKSDKSVEREKPKEEEMPQSWTEVKLRKMDFEKISKIKSRIFKFADDRNLKRGELKKPDVEECLKKEDYVKPQLIFEQPSLLRTAVFATTEGLKRKQFPPEIIRFTEKLPSISYCENPSKCSYLFRNRKQTLSEIPEERAEIMMKIIENKNRPTETGKYVQGVWYSSDYLTESKTEVEAVTSYGLSVLSEMYNDDQEETHETEPEKPKSSKHKEKKSKKKHKKRKSKTKSRSSSKEKEQKHDEEQDNKTKQSEEVDDNKDKNSSELINKPEEEIPAEKSPFKEEEIQEKDPNEDNTPNTDEYRSNWESDEDILNEIMRTDDRTSYNKPYQRSLDKNWEIEDEISERRQFDDKERRKTRRNSSERIPEEQTRRRSEEDKRKHIRLSEERHNYEKSEPKEDMVGFDSRRSSTYRRSEEKHSSRRSYERSESKKSTDYKLNHEDKTDYETRRLSSNLRRSEDKDYIKSRNTRNESIERHRKLSDSDRHRKTSESSRHEDDRRSRHSLEHDRRRPNDERTRIEPEEHSKKSVEEKIDRDNKKSKENRRESLEKSRDRKHESEESNKQETKRKIEEKDRHPPKETKSKRSSVIEETKISREKKISCSSSKSERSQTPDAKKTEKPKTQNIVYHKWSSEEDIHKSAKKSAKDVEESSIQLNLNYKKYQKSQWSSDEDFDKQRSLSDDRRNFEDDFQYMDKEKSRKPRSKSRWGDNTSDNGSISYQNRYENLLDDDLVNLKSLERNRKIVEEIKEKRNRSKEREDEISRKSSKKKYKAEKKKADEKEKYKKNKKKGKDKKAKLKSKKSKEKKPKVKLNYSEEDSYDEDFKTAKQKEQDLFIKANSDSAKRYVAKIKIDYSDFDLSLSESKDKYAKKVEESLQTSPEISKNVDLPVTPNTPKERKMNIDLSEIIINHQASETTTAHEQSTIGENVESISPKTPELPKTIPETPDSPTVSLESPKLTQKTPELSKPSPKTPDLPKTSTNTSELSKSTTETSELLKSTPQTSEILKSTLQTSELQTSSPITPEVLKTSELQKSITKTCELPTTSFVTHKNEEVTPKYTLEISEKKAPKAALKIEGITPIIPKDKKSPTILPTPTRTPNKILPDISPVAPPTPIPKPVTEVPVPVTPDPSKLVSEYEEFMKAVCFEDTVVEISSEVKVDEPETQKKEEAQTSDDSKKDDESDSSLEETSSEYESSEEEHSTSSDSESDKMKMLETVAKIKTEKFTDSENDSQESRTEKRKRNELDSGSDVETFENIVVKTEKDTKKMKKSEIKTFECESKYDNVIDWEKSCVEYKNYEEQNKFTLDISVLPENIPLPSDNIQDIPTPDFSSPIEVINISSDSTTPSPTKKPRSFIPIKLLTAESRKQANETAKLVTSDQTSGFGKFTPKDLVTQDEEKVISVGSSSDISLTNSDNYSIVTPNETAEDQESSSRKRQSQWALNITPAKKPLLQTTPIGEDDSDEDFTDKFIKQTDKKEPKKPEDKPEVTKELLKSEPSNNEDKKEDKKPEPRKTKETDDKPQKASEKQKETREKPRHKDEHRRSLSPKRSTRRSSLPRTDRYDKPDRNDRKDKSRDSLDRKRDRSRDLPIKESLRDREKRRLSDRRLSDRKPQFSRGRSPRSRYSRDRELQRGGNRLRDRSKDRINKHKEVDRDRERSREKIRELDRNKDHRERDDRRYNRRDDRRFSRSPTPRKDYRELDIPVPGRLDDTDFSATSMDIVQSPVNSPLDGFKRSLADSTISDSELVTQLNTPDESNEPSPAYSHLHPPQQYYPHVQDMPPECSPKRISLDDRINLVLGLEKEPPKPIDTVCTRGPYTNTTAQNYDPYGYSRSEYDLYTQPQSDGYVPPYSNQYQSPYYPTQLNSDNNIKVVQVGNVIQVVPTEQPVAPAPKPVDVGPPKVLQVGNMLQIVPMTIIETAASAVSSPVVTVAPTVVAEKPVVPTKSTDQLVQERRAEKEKRRQEREQRRKEKEKKRKEKEKRRQQKIKTKTENMIKRALMLETGEGELDISNIDAEPPVTETVDNNNLPLSWPPASSLTPVLLPKAPGKGILVSHGFREKDESSLDDSTETRKVVKFADGICPGEGTSPSGGEELPSPPPPPRKLPKEKRYKRIKSNKNKKKIKVKIIRTQQQAEDESSSEDNLPPPPPPPGSPPPHLWPPRVKQPPVNNIHPALLPHVLYPPAFPPRQHHPPVMPVLQTGPPPPPPHHGAHQPSFHH